jgi:hypothetical protein
MCWAFFLERCPNMMTAGMLKEVALGRINYKHFTASLKYYQWLIQNNLHPQTHPPSLVATMRWS